MILGALLFFARPDRLPAQENPDAPAPAEVYSDTNSTLPGPEAQPGSGTFTRSPFRISASIREGYDDNVYTTSVNPTGSFYTNGSIDVNYRFGNDRTQFALEAFGGLSYYYNRPMGQAYDINTGFSFAASHQVSPRLSLSANLYLAYQTEPDFNTGFGINRRSGNFLVTTDRFAASYQWAPRFSTLTSYTLSAVNYDDNSIGAYENRTEHTFGNEFRFLLLPTTTLVGEYRYEIISYQTAPRDSTTNFVLAGVDHTFNPRFNISVRGGAEFRQFQDYSSQASPYGELTLNYALGERTSLSWLNRYGLDEPDVPGAASRTTFRTGLQASYTFTPRISSTLAVFYQHDSNDANTPSPLLFVPAFNEDTIDVALGVRYAINRTFAVIAGYNHTEVISDISLRQYTRNRYYLGLNVAF